MKKEIICVLTLLLLLSTSSVIVTAKNIDNEKMTTLNDNHPPESKGSQGVWSVTWCKNGMSAGFSSEAYDEDGDECKLVVKICKRGTSNERTKSSEFSEDYRRKSVSFSLDPDEYPIGTYVDWELWVEDEHGAQSAHWESEFYVKRSNSKRVLFKNNILEFFPNLHFLAKIIDLLDL